MEWPSPRVVLKTAEGHESTLQGTGQRATKSLPCPEAIPVKETLPVCV